LRATRTTGGPSGIVVGDVVPAVVITAPKTGPARLKIGSSRVDLERAGYAWTRRTSAVDLFKPGDLVDVAIAKLDATGGAATVTLEQTPLAEGAMLAIDNHSGQIKAMVGGWSFKPQQVQSGRAGLPAARLDLQADRLHGGDRPRLHADVDPDGCAGQLSGGQRPDLQPAQLRSQIPGADHPPIRARGVA